MKIRKGQELFLSFFTVPRVDTKFGVGYNYNNIEALYKKKNPNTMHLGKGINFT